jgi:hypothetical protein
LVSGVRNRGIPVIPSKQTTELWFARSAEFPNDTIWFNRGTSEFGRRFLLSPGANSNRFDESLDEFVAGASAVSLLQWSRGRPASKVDDAELETVEKGFEHFPQLLVKSSVGYHMGVGSGFWVFLD